MFEDNTLGYMNIPIQSSPIESETLYLNLHLKMEIFYNIDSM